MKKNVISVLIPCYNLQDYLPRCIESILNQTYKDLEIIAVDDGSNDNTYEILKEYEKKDSRVRAIHQENKGAGEALNRGIELATGEFITIVDNDDWIEPTMYERMHSALEKNNSDVAVVNFNLAYPDHIDREYSYTNRKDETVTIKDDIFSFFTSYCACPKPNNYIWSRLYRSEIIKESDVRFENFRLGADSLFYFKHLPRINKVSFIKEGLYNYYQRSNSCIHTAANESNVARVYAEGFESLVDYYERHGYDDYKSFLQIYAYTRVRSIFFYSRLAGLQDDEIHRDIKEAFEGMKIKDYFTGAAK